MKESNGASTRAERSSFNYFPLRHRREILDFVLSDFPQPLAITYARLNEEMDKDRPVSAAWQLKDCLEAFIKFFACIASADFLQASPRYYPGRTEERVGNLVALLLKPQGLSLGDWHALLRDSLCEIIPIGGSELPVNTELVLPELYVCFYQVGKIRRGNPLMTDIHRKISGSVDTVISWRNRVFGHGVFRNAPEWYAEEVTQWLNVLHKFYYSVKSIIDNIQFFSIDNDGKECEWRGMKEMPPGFAHKHVPEDESLSMFIKARSRWLELSPFLTLQRCSICGQSTIFFFDRDRYESRKDIHRTWFLEYWGGHHEDKRDLEKIRELASQVPPGYLWERTSYDQDEVDTIVRTKEQSFERDYRRPNYLMDALSSGIERLKRGYLYVVGPSGIGKSWLIRGMELEWENEGIPVLSYYIQPGILVDYRTFISELADHANQNFRWRTQEIQTKVASIRDLREQFAEFCGELMKANRLSRLVIAIDGLDELPEPEKGQPAITGLLPSGEKLPVGCFVVLTSRSQVRSAIGADIHRLSLCKKDDGFFCQIHIDPKTQENRGMLLEYLKNKLPEKWHQTELMEEIINKAHGIFLYVFHFACALDSGLFDDLQELPEAKQFYPAYLAKLCERVGEDFFNEYYLKTLLYLTAVKEPVSIDMLSEWGLKTDGLAFSLMDMHDFIRSEQSKARPEKLYQVAHQDFIRYVKSDDLLSEKLREVHRQIARTALKQHSGFWIGLDFDEPVERYHLLWIQNHLEAGQLEQDLESLLIDDEYMEMFMNMAYFQHDIAQYRYAIMCYERIERIFRQEAEKKRDNRQNVEHSLAIMLNEKGAALESLGQPYESLKCADESIGIYQRLVEAGSLELENDLAMAIMNKGVALDSLGQFSNAVRCYDKAIVIRRKLVESGSLELEYDLAIAIVNKGVTLNSLNQNQEAIEHFAEGIGIYQRLMESGRKGLEDNLADAITNKGVAFGSLNQIQEALECFDEAIRIYQKLAESGRKELEDGLADTITNKGIAIRSLDRPQEAVKCYDEAIDIYQRLIRDGRTELESSLAGTIMNKGVAFDSLDQPQEAIECYNRAIDIYQRIVEGGRKELEDELAMAILNKGLVQEIHGQLQEAIGCYNEAIDIYQRLVESGRKELEADLADAIIHRDKVLESHSQP